MKRLRQDTAEPFPNMRPPLAELSVLTFFDQDNRPTIIFDLLDDRASPAYANASYRQLKSLSQHDHDSLAQWARRHTPDIYKLGGQTWMGYTLQEHWRIVVGGPGSGITAKLSEGDSHPANAGATVAETGNDPPSFLRTGSGTSTKSSASIETVHTPSSASSASSQPVLIDWTVNELPGLSTFVQQFRAFDWKSTPLGPISQWSPILRRWAVHIMSSQDPRVIVWGPDMIIIYNEASVPVIGRRHPQALGKTPGFVFPEAWTTLEPLFVNTYRGNSIKMKELPIAMFREGFDEECFFTVTLQPLCGDDGEVVGVMDSFQECTNFVITDRRLSMITEIGEITGLGSASMTMDQIWAPLTGVFESKVDDVPFALLYSISGDEDGDIPSSSSEASIHGSEILHSLQCNLEGVVGVQPDAASALARLTVQDSEQETHPFGLAFRQAWETKSTVLVQKLPVALQVANPGRAGGSQSSKAVVIPLSGLGKRNLVGLIVLGLSARRPYDEDYRLFTRLLHDRLSHSIAVISLPLEQRLAQAAVEEATLRHATMSRQLLLRTQEAERSESKFARLYERAPVGMYLLRPDGSPLYVNQAWQDLTNLDATEQPSFDGANATWRDHINEEDEHKVNVFWSQLTVQKRPAMTEYRLKRPWISKDENGVQIEGTTWLLASAIPEMDEDGEVTAIMGWLSDISLQKWSEKLQSQRLEEALEAKYQTERFIDCVSHEIRNPLSAILQSADGILASLEENKTSQVEASQVPRREIESILDSAQTIVFCTQHQKRIVDDILTFSKLDSNLIVLCPEIIKPSALLDRALSMFQSELKAAGIMAQRQFQSPIMFDDNIVCDASRVLQVIINLLTNAIKFTRGRDERTITMSFSVSSGPPEESLDGVVYVPRRPGQPSVNFSSDWGQGKERYVQFTVIDTGRGLADDEMELLFQRFTQANAKTYSQYGGSGLGLFICKQMCELHGGQIGVSSTFGKGSTFAFYIKALEHVVEPTSFSPTSLRRSSLADSVRHASHHASVSYTPLGAPPTATEIEGFFGTTMVAPPSAVPSTLERAGLLDRQIRNVKELTVLIVEDNVLNQKVMAAQLRKAGCNVILASHGGEAINVIEHSEFASDELFARHDASEERLPLTVVLMDLEMPVMDGLTCINRIREMERHGELIGRVPVAAVTANARSSQLKDALDAGMDTVVTKPFRIGDLIPRIMKLANGQSGDAFDSLGLTFP